MALLLLLWNLFAKRAGEKLRLPLALRVLVGTCHTLVVAPYVDFEGLRNMLRARGHQVEEFYPFNHLAIYAAYNAAGYRFLNVVYLRNDTVRFPDGVTPTLRNCPPGTPHTPE